MIRTQVDSRDTSPFIPAELFSWPLVLLQLPLEGHRHSYFTSVCYQAMTRTTKFVPFVTHRLAKELIYINRLFQLLRLDLLDCFTFTPTTYISWLFEHWCPTTMTTTTFFIDDVLVGGISGSGRISGHTTNDMWSNVFHTTSTSSLSGWDWVTMCLGGRLHLYLELSTWDQV